MLAVDALQSIVCNVGSLYLLECQCSMDIAVCHPGIVGELLAARPCMDTGVLLQDKEGSPAPPLATQATAPPNPAVQALKLPASAPASPAPEEKQLVLQDVLAIMTAPSQAKQPKAKAKRASQGTPKGSPAPPVQQPPPPQQQPDAAPRPVRAAKPCRLSHWPCIRIACDVNGSQSVPVSREDVSAVGPIITSRDLVEVFSNEWLPC